jgi:VWFA-related protein
MAGAARSAAVRVLAAGAIASALCVVATGQTPKNPQDPQRPIFRGGANLVLVDAYPRRDGRIVEGLTPADFEVTEDGTPQAIDQFEFVRVEPAFEDERRDPNTQQEMLQQTADPHNRVFVVYLDGYHITRQGARAIGSPLINLLSRVLAVGDLFGVTTPKFPASSLVLGRKLTAIEAQLAQDSWGERGELVRSSVEEQQIDQCFTVDPTRVGFAVDPTWYVSDDGVTRLMTDVLVERSREERSLAVLKDLVTHVGDLREARTTLIVVSSGWRLFAPDQQLQAQSGKEPSTVPKIGVPQGGGRVGILNQSADGIATSAVCNDILSRLAQLDDRRVFMDVVSLANRSNVVFYPVNPAGLETSDAQMAGAAIGIPATMADMSHARARSDSAITLATETDGIAVIGTNDLHAGMARIIDDVSAYYLLGYYSTNPKADGKLRKIKVRVKQSNVTVAARRGYVVPTAASVAARAAVKPAVPPTSVAPAEVTEALGVLSRLGATTSLFAAGTVAGQDLAVVAEIASGQVEMGKWAEGGTVRVTVTGPAGEPAGTGAGTIEPGARGALVHVPVSAGAGPWRANLTVSGKDGTVEESVDLRTPTGRWLGDPLVFRGASSARAVLRPVADFLFHRTERVHIEIPILSPIERRVARLLDRRGQPVPVDATVTERDEAGRPTLVADLNLAPLSAGDYVLEITAGQGDDTQRRFVGMRVVR